MSDKISRRGAGAQSKAVVPDRCPFELEIDEIEAGVKAEYPPTFSPTTIRWIAAHRWAGRQNNEALAKWSDYMAEQSKEGSPVAAAFREISERLRSGKARKNSAAAGAQRETHPRRSKS